MAEPALTSRGPRLLGRFWPRLPCLVGLDGWPGRLDWYLLLCPGQSWAKINLGQTCECRVYSMYQESSVVCEVGGGLLYLGLSFTAGNPLCPMPVGKPDGEWRMGNGDSANT